MASYCFYNILDLSCINGFVLCKERTGDFISSRDFILKLAIELREDYLAERRARRSTPEQDLSRTNKKYLQRK